MILIGTAHVAVNSMLETWLSSQNSDLAKTLPQALRKLNLFLKNTLHCKLQIGPSHFFKKNLSPQSIATIWNHSLRYAVTDTVISI